MVALLVKEGFSIIFLVSVVIYFISASPEITRSVEIFATLVTLSLEALSIIIVPFIFSGV